MRNIVRVLCLAVTMTFALVSCREDAEIPDRGPVVYPQEDVKGTYVGEWSQQQVGKEEIIYAEGTLVLSPSEANYVTNITVNCTDLNIDMSAVANIAPGGSGYMFSNVYKDGNGFGTEFAGRINKADMSITLSYKKTVKVGIKSSTYVFTFNGVRE